MGCDGCVGRYEVKLSFFFGIAKSTYITAVQHGTSKIADVNMSSVAGIHPFPGGSLYSASKHALEGKGFI